MDIHFKGLAPVPVHNKLCFNFIWNQMEILKWLDEFDETCQKCRKVQSDDVKSETMSFARRKTIKSIVFFDSEMFFYVLKAIISLRPESEYQRLFLEFRHS